MQSVGKTVATVCAVAVAGLVAFAVSGLGRPVTPVEPIGTFYEGIALNVSDRDVTLTPAQRAMLSPYYVLVIGNDSRTGTPDISEAQYADGNARSDVMMLLRIDPNTYQISLLSIPRDTPVRDAQGNVQKINDAYRWSGGDGAVAATEALTGLDILYYVDMGFVQFANFYDQIGGIEVDVPIYMDFRDIISGSEHIYLEPGVQTLNGPQALVFARVRKQFVYGDASRQADDRQIVKNTITRVASSGEGLQGYIDAFNANIYTDWPREDLTAQIQKFSEHASDIHFVEGTGPYDGDWIAEWGNWFCYEDTETWGKIVKVFAEGGDPQTVFADPPIVPAG